VIEQPH